MPKHNLTLPAPETNSMMRRSVRIAVLFAAVVLVCGQVALAQVKNVILMIADGAGFNTWNATSMYQGKWDAANGRSTQVYDGEGWVHLACSTYPLNSSKAPTNDEKQDENLVYDPAKAWDPAHGYEWLQGAYTDSAAAATALSTGKKTYDTAINWSNTNQPISPTLVELAKSLGKATGVITTVQWSHATPAGLGGAQNVLRDHYQEIAQQLVQKQQLDVIMGAGNPDFDDNGRPKEGTKEFKYVGGEEAWKAIKEARAAVGGTHLGFRPVSTRAEFEALASGSTPAKVLGTAQVAQTLQAAREGVGPDDPPYDDPLISGVPTLADMARGALNVLDDNPCGMFLMIEGGAVDWANHKRHPGRMIEEQADFNRAVQAVVDWVEKNSNWNETLLILTADHETGLLWGKDSETKPFDPVVDNGVGKMPGLHHNVGTHTNSLVPVYACGDAATLFVDVVVGSDPVRGPYITNTSIFEVIRAAMALEIDETEPTVMRTASW
jgi:alkaline phosphatase